MGEIGVFGEMRSFFVVASAITSARGSDQHLVSKLEFSCELTALNVHPENWDGYRQPFAPPPRLPLPSPPVTLQPASATSPSLSAAAGFGAAFVVTTVVLAAAAIVARVLKPRQHKSAATEETIELCAEGKSGWHHSLAMDAADEAAGHDFDVFLSYRRVDYRLADTLHDKLRLSGLRVFKDVAGRMAGSPFNTELIRAIRSAPVFAPVVTLDSLQRMAADAEIDIADVTLAEWMAALHFRASGHVRLISPLLAGPTPPLAGPGEEQQRYQSLLRDARYALALDALPDAPSAATTRAVEAALRACSEAPLSAEEAAMSIRDIVSGPTGLLSGPVFAVDCLPDDLGLYIGSRYAPRMLQVVEAAAHPERADSWRNTN